MQQSMAQNADSKTLAGLAIGKLLRGLFDDWKERYDARDVLNQMAAMEENKRKEMLAYLEKTNPTQHRRMQEYLAKNDGTWGTWKNSPQPAPQTTSNTAAPTQAPQQSEFSGVNPNARAVQQTTQKLLGDTDFWQPWDNDRNWNKWGNLFSGAGWQQNGLRF